MGRHDDHSLEAGEQVSYESALARCGLPRNEALRLLACVIGSTRESVLGNSTRCMDADMLARFRTVAEKRRQGAPIAYLLGEREFYGRRFAVDPRVLIPRHETELLVDLGRQRLELPGRIDGRARAWSPRVLDLGTGCGAIAITLALEIPEAAVTATDLSSGALEVARANAAALGADVRFLGGDWYAALEDLDTRFDLIVSNPPYVAGADRHLDEGDARFEPRLALTDEADGLAALRTVVGGAAERLRPGGTLLVEHGYDQGAAARALFAKAGYRDAGTWRDLAGLERITGGSVP